MAGHVPNDTYNTDPDSATMIIAKLQTPVKANFEKVNDDLKEIHSGLNKYSKALEKKFKDRPLPFADNDALTTQTSLIDRAIAMHLLREGHFDVASTFINEVNSKPIPYNPNLSDNASWEADFAPSRLKSTTLQQQFSSMYHILHEMRSNGNLSPAIQWAQQNSSALSARGSNLEFDLCRLQYISLFISSSPLAAVAYARQTFPSFGARYAAQTTSLLGALAFTPNIAASPYSALLTPGLTDSDTMTTAASAFTSEFCALLSLSSASPLLTAVTAGYLALPTLLKLSQIQQTHRTSWTTAQELPVEVPLPSAYQFHSVFVCPVSKEQSTDANPPVVMPCGHVIARESCERISKGGRFKCPYCPGESHLRDAKVVYL